MNRSVAAAQNQLNTISGMREDGQRRVLAYWKRCEQVAKAKALKSLQGLVEARGIAWVTLQLAPVQRA
jgi:hypothetical protein